MGVYPRAPRCPLVTELITSGPSAEAGGGLLNALGRSVLAGERFAIGDTVATGSGVARIGAVDPTQYQLDTFNVWHNLSAFGVFHVSELEALQVFAPPEWFCS